LATYSLEDSIISTKAKALTKIESTEPGKTSLQEFAIDQLLQIYSVANFLVGAINWVTSSNEDEEHNGCKPLFNGDLVFVFSPSSNTFSADFDDLALSTGPSAIHRCLKSRSAEVRPEELKCYDGEEGHPMVSLYLPVPLTTLGEERQVSPPAPEDFRSL
jgi:hypothetical protein